MKLIEPDHFPDVGKMAEHIREDTKMIEPSECEHEWENYVMYNPNTGENKDFRKCDKCGLEEDIEPTDNTKIEELDPDNYNLDNLSLIVTDIFKKLNEVIRKLNKED